MSQGIPENSKFEALSPEKRFEAAREELMREVQKNPNKAAKVVFGIDQYPKTHS